MNGYGAEIQTPKKHRTPYNNNNLYIYKTTMYMKIEELKQKLHRYIETANEKKRKAIPQAKKLCKFHFGQSRS
jgi:hypothetical protein